MTILSILRDHRDKLVIPLSILRYKFYIDNNTGSADFCLPQSNFISGVPVQVGLNANPLTFTDKNGCDSLVNYYKSMS